MTQPPSYNPVTPRIVAELRAIVGAAYVIWNDAEKMEPFSHDAVPDPKFHHMPEVVVRPADAAQIAAIMKLANRERIPVTPRGAGSGLSGGAIPVFGGILLSVDRMNRILEIDRANMVVVVEPGVVTNEINEALKEHGLFYPGYPMSLEMCFIGGNVAENAGGGKAVKYGVTGRYVIGLDLVTPKGDLLSLGGKLAKDVTGYNLIQLMVGSEGTLGIFTKITLKLMPLPKTSVSLLCLFDDLSAAIGAVPRIMAESGITVASAEFVDAPSIRCACDYLNETLPIRDAGALLLISLDGASEEQVEREYDAIGDLALQCGARQVYVADSSTTAERLWRFRRNVPEALYQIAHLKISEDLVAPMASVPKLVAGLKEIAARYHVQAPCFGHAGDGNIHVHIIAGPGWEADRWPENKPKVLAEMYELTASLGGTLSGEHGVGNKRKEHMPRFVSETYMETARAIKRALDPNLVLNPGKIFDV